MGFFWEMFQEVQIGNRRRENMSLDDRVALLEQELDRTQNILAATLEKLEEVTNEDLSGNGHIGKV